MGIKKNAVAAGILLGAASAGLLIPASANAATSAPVTSSITVPMTVGGYDSAVAEAHGYKIITNADGTQSSVPVTPEAKAEAASAASSSPSGVHVLTTTPGDCGTATLDITPNKSKGGIDIYSAYTLTKGVSYYHVWNVSGASNLGKDFSEGFSGANNLDNNWSASHFQSLYGYSSGSAHIVPGSHAELTNGTVCYAGTVVNSWHS